MAVAPAGAVGEVEIAAGGADYVCPDCTGMLRWVSDALQCVVCGASFRCEDGVAALTHWQWGGWENRLDEETQLLLACAREHATLKRTVEEFVRRRATGRAEVMARRLAHPGRMAPTVLLDIRPEYRLLDLGCGLDGSLGFALAPRLRRVDVLDIRPERLAFLRALMDGCTGRVALAQGGDGRHLPFPADTFDLVVLHGAFTRWPVARPNERAGTRRRLLEELRRVLKPGGQLCLAAENLFSCAGAVRSVEHALSHSKMDSVQAGAQRRAPLALNQIGSSTAWGYRRMLDRAAFVSSTVFAAHPDYEQPLYLLPVSRDPAVPPRAWKKFCKNAVVPLRRKGWEPRIRAAVGRVVRRKVGRYFAHSFVVVSDASEARVPPIALARRMLRDGLGDDAVPLAVLVRATDCVVIPAYRAATDALVYLKVPLSRAGGAAHARHYRLVARLRRLCPELPVPEPLACGEVQGHRYGIEAALPGMPGARVGGSIDTLVRRAASAIAGLHRRTRSTRVDATRRIWQWRVRGAARHRSTRERKGIEELHDLFVDGLTRLPFTVTAHNDYHLGNVLFDEHSRVSGILDWDSAELEGLPGVDIIHLIVSSYRRRTGAPLGQTISRWLRGCGGIEREVFQDYRGTIELPASLSWCVRMYVGVELWRLCLQQRYGLRCPTGSRRIDKIIDELIAIGGDLAARER